MKKLKLKLDELKVQSFVTELNPGLAQTAKGGDDDGGYGSDTVLCETIKASINSILGASAQSNFPCRRACNSGSRSKSQSQTVSRTQAPGGGGNPNSNFGA